jgi:hypothetical protein
MPYWLVYIIHVENRFCNTFRCNLFKQTSSSSSSGSSKGREGVVVSTSLNGMTVAVEDAIQRLIKGYRDVLVTYSLPQIYAEALKKKLEEREL